MDHEHCRLRACLEEAMGASKVPLAALAIVLLLTIAPAGARAGGRDRDAR
jgi:hypothetical protein